VHERDPLGPRICSREYLRQWCLPGRLSSILSAHSALLEFSPISTTTQHIIMSGFPKLKLIDRSAFPSKIRMPDITGYTSEVFALKVNPHWHEAEAGSYAWFDSFGIIFINTIIPFDTHNLSRCSHWCQASGVLRYRLWAHGRGGLPRRRLGTPPPIHGFHPLVVCCRYT
jgi:hypothetical protein